MAGEKTSLLDPDVETGTSYNIPIPPIKRNHIIGFVCAVAGLLLVGYWAFGRGSGTPNGTQHGSMKNDLRLAFLINNRSPQRLPYSYMVDPPDFFEKQPENLRPRNHMFPDFGPAECPVADVKAASLEQWDNYTYQTEKMVVSKGCNIYDAGVGSIALAVGGQTLEASRFYREILDKGATAGLANIRGNAPCVGREAFKECDPQKDGACGLCYGDVNGTMSPPYRQTWFYRMIGDYWEYFDTENALCPVAQSKSVPKSTDGSPPRPHYWRWMDWKPVLGDNAWVLLTGPAHVLWQASNGDGPAIPTDAPELGLALDFLASLKVMKAGESGGLYFCPRNTYYGSTHVDIGSLVSTENNASVLAGLKALRYMLKSMKRAIFDAHIKEIEDLIEGIKKFLHSAYDPSKQHFRTGGRWNQQTKSMLWDEEIFAVDCQSWVGSVLGPAQIDEWFGSGAALKLWEKTKKVAGYSPQPNGMVKGVGYSQNDQAQVLSGEWSYGAANFLKIMAADKVYSSSVRSGLLAQANLIAKAVADELTRDVTLRDEPARGILYANKRYMIPIELGGWWANPLPSRASTSWSFLWDADFNPLHLQGKFSADYDM